MKTGDAYLDYLLKSYRAELKKQKREFKTLPAGSLTLRKQNGHINFVHLIPASQATGGKRIRKGVTGDKDTLQKLARKAYLEISIDLLTKEVVLLEQYLKTRIEPSPENVLPLLPKWRQDLPESAFFPQRRNADKWASADYWRNSKYQEELRHITTRGLRVRSKSELIIAEKLDAYGIPYRYDQVLQGPYHPVSPDFTFKTEDDFLYWEHCGKMAKPSYRDYNKWKLAQYETMGIVPWKNLIITYDSEDGDLDVRIIDAEIRNRLL